MPPIVMPVELEFEPEVKPDVTLDTASSDFEMGATLPTGSVQLTVLLTVVGHVSSSSSTSAIGAANAQVSSSAERMKFLILASACDESSRYFERVN